MLLAENSTIQALQGREGKGLTLREVCINWIKVFPSLGLQFSCHTLNRADTLSELEGGEQTSRQKEREKKKKKIHK